MPDACVGNVQYWLGGSPENLESLMLMMANNYVYEGDKMIEEEAIAEPTLLPDIGVWHPLAPQVFEDSTEYNTWYDKVHAPLVGINPKTAMLHKSKMALASALLDFTCHLPPTPRLLT